MNDRLDCSSTLRRSVKGKTSVCCEYDRRTVHDGETGRLVNLGFQILLRIRDQKRGF